MRQGGAGGEMAQRHEEGFVGDGNAHVLNWGDISQ